MASAELPLGHHSLERHDRFRASGKATHDKKVPNVYTHRPDRVRRQRRSVERRLSTETKAAFKTTEFIAYVVAVVGVLVAAAIVDATDFGSQDAWFFVTLLTIGYMVSRGLAKSGSRDFYDAEQDDHDGAGNR